jgi:hypothetical protein
MRAVNGKTGKTGKTGADGVLVHERNAHHRDRSGIWGVPVPNAEEERKNTT